MKACKACRIFEEGGRSSGRLTEVAPDELDGGELLIRATYSSINYKDALAATGTGKVVRRFPLVGGIDVAGVVDAFSDGRFEEADKVLVTGYGMGEDHDGGYSEWVRVPADWAVPIPDGIDEWEAMALGTAGLTAVLAIHKLELNGLHPEGGPVAVTGATGGVGSLATDMLAGLGYEVTAITGKKGSTATWSGSARLRCCLGTPSGRRGVLWRKHSGREPWTRSAARRSRG